MSELCEFMLVADKNREEAFQIAETTAKKLDSKQITLITVVQSLGEYINDEDAVIRGKAVSYLTAVIKALPPKFLSRQQIQVLTSFYCDRVEDGGAIAGLDTLQSLGRFSTEMVEITARALFSHSAALRGRPQAQRFQTLQLLNGLMANHRDVLRNMKAESLEGIVELVSGERDPRNLMLIFSILKVVMVEWDISNNVQMLFDSVYNYFPITFRPPPNDPYGISAQDLKSRLQGCISSIQLFAPHAFPLLLDKLDSTSFNVKKDALNALGACVSSYDQATVSRYSIMIWDALKFEILNAQEEILAEESLRIIRLVARRLSQPPPSQLRQSHLAHFLKPITKECNEQLREPQLKQAKPALQILGFLSSVSPSAFSFVIDVVMAPLLRVYQEADGISKKRVLLEAFTILLESGIAVFGTWDTRGPDSTASNSLEIYRDRLSDLFSKALVSSPAEEISFRIAALKAILRLCALRGFLQDGEIGLFVRYFNDILLRDPPESTELRKEAVLALTELSRYKPRMIMDITFPAFMATLPDSNTATDLKYLQSLESLAQISVERDVFETLVRRLLGKLETVLHGSESQDPTYTRAIFQTILFATERKGLDSDPSLELYFDKIVVKQCQRVALAAMEDTLPPMQDPVVLDTLGRLCNLIVHSVPRNTQDFVSSNIYNLFTTQERFTPIPCMKNATASQRQTMTLSTYLLASLPKDSNYLPPSIPDIKTLISDIVRLSASEGNVPTQLALNRQLAILVNKYLPTTALPMASEILFSLVPVDGSTSDPATIKTVFWLSKALILRLAPTIERILIMLLSLLSSPDPHISSTSARGFSLLLSDDDVLSTRNGANIRLLAKQRVFSIIIPLISTHVRELNTAVASAANTSTTPEQLPVYAKQAYLTALSGILSSVPSSLVMPELPSLFPLLLQSLDLSNAESQSIKSSTLETLTAIVRENGVRVISDLGYIDNLVTRLLKTATYSNQSATAQATLAHSKSVTRNTLTASTTAAGQKDTHNIEPNSAYVRTRALHCLLLLVTAPRGASHTAGNENNAEKSQEQQQQKPSPLLPVKDTVLRSLRLILDDPKRDVRKAAVDARAAWLRSVEDLTVEGEED